MVTLRPYFRLNSCMHFASLLCVLHATRISPSYFYHQKYLVTVRQYKIPQHEIFIV